MRARTEENMLLYLFPVCFRCPQQTSTYNFCRIITIQLSGVVRFIMNTTHTHARMSAVVLCGVVLKFTHTRKHRGSFTEEEPRSNSYQERTTRPLKYKGAGRP